MALTALVPCVIKISAKERGYSLLLYRFFRYYSATILQMSGVRDDRLAIWLAGLTTLTNFLFTLLGVWLVERVGRRKLTLGSITGEKQRAAGRSAGEQTNPHFIFQQVHV